MRTAITYILIGGASFWLPEIVFAAARRVSAIDAIGGILLTVLVPVVPIAMYFLFRKRKSQNKPQPSLALFMTVGVWLMGPLSMTIVATFAGTGFTTWHGLSDAGYLLLFTVLPIYTLMMSAYNGTIVALILFSFLMVLFHFSLERGHWLVPPPLKRLLHFPGSHQVS